MSLRTPLASTRLLPAALALAALAGPVAAPAGDVDKALPFVADDYPKALAEARAQKLPLFIEAWAPW
jgi:hypothetical protein